jgi:uncharacterized protein YciI
VAGYHLVKLAHGPDWDDARGLREQAGWEEHAAYMDELAEDGFIVLGGPVDLGADAHVLLVVHAEDEDAIRARLAPDPWTDGVVRIASVSPWSVWLRAPRAKELPQ